MNKHILSLTLGILLFTTSFAHALSVTSSNDANALVNSILGSGVTINSASLTAAPGSVGSFSGAASVIGIDKGIILTSGQATNAPGPNNSDGASSGNGFSGSAALTTLSGQSTNDAAILDITFTTTTNSLFFNFVFASEEYNEYVNQFNDIFAFFLDGVNIALLPNNTPISINNVNQGMNSAYFVNNDPSEISASNLKDIQYDGFTTVLTAQALSLAAGNHTISIQIADGGDSSLDSAIFIQGGSFGGTKPPVNPVPEPGTVLLFGAGMLGLAAKRFFWKK